MLFPSVVFLFAFFPIMLIVYFGSLKLWGKKSLLPANIVLLMGSLIFYGYGEGLNVLLLAGSILINWLAGLVLASVSEKSLRKLVLICTLIIDFSVLFVFKYLDFSFGLMNNLLGISLPVFGLALPIGISFFTFQAASYTIDVYRGDVQAEKNPLYTGLYISFFPQLIAGPIVRYTDIAQGIRKREHSFDVFAQGTVRFIEGLIKKAIIADSLSAVADRIFSHIAGGLEVSVLTAWLGAITFTLQIYFDFSGYSDMAIGLGAMFGFNLKENFNYPYVAASVKEFWRRWHISLSTWFRDYVYIPLGGNRKGTLRTVLNLFVVWLFTGIWHGAGFTFIAWGLMYFVLLTIERLTGYGDRFKLPAWIGRIYTMLFVMAGWVVFKSSTLKDAYRFFRRMAGLETVGLVDGEFCMYIKNNWFILILAVLLSTPIVKKTKEKGKNTGLLYFSYGLFLLIALIYVFKGGYSPFIYFNF